jgi:hypothetical protein
VINWRIRIPLRDIVFLLTMETYDCILGQPHNAPDAICKEWEMSLRSPSSYPYGADVGLFPVDRNVQTKSNTCLEVGT